MGNRPLCLGKLGEGWVVASESCALSTIGASLIGDVLPGMVMEIDAQGPRHAAMVARAEHEPGFCLFEYVYLSRADSRFEGRSVYASRRAMGHRLAREHPANAEVVAAVPDSGIAAALGYAEELGLPFVEVLMKNRYVGRTFISPDIRTRARDVDLKFSTLDDNVAGRSIVLVDDSLVRGTTMRSLIRQLRRANVGAVHLRIAAPPVRHPCPLGVDIPTFEELIAHERDVDAVCRAIGADSLGYLSLEGLIAATERPAGALCAGCFGGRFPRPYGGAHVSLPVIAPPITLAEPVLQEVS